MVCLHAMHRPLWEASGSQLLALLEPVLERGALGVPLFFVISGFCIHLRWAKDASAGKKPRVDFLGFWKRRLWRLYPAYFAALLVAVLLLVVRVWKGLPNPYPGDFAVWLSKDFLLHALMLHGLHPSYDYEGGNVVFWTLAREEYLYLLYFPLLALRRRMPIVGVGLLIGSLGLALPRVVHWLTLASDSGPLTVLRYAFNNHSSAVALWIQWALGAVAVEAYCRLATLPRWTRSWLAAAGWALVAELAKALAITPLVPIAWGLCFFTMVNASVHGETQVASRSDRLTSFFAFTGRFSYSLYLIHLPALVVLQKAEQILRTSMGLDWLASSVPYLLASWVAFVAGGWAGGWLFFQAVERHFLPRRA